MPVKDMPPKCAATLDTFDSELPPPVVAIDQSQMETV